MISLFRFWRCHSSELKPRTEVQISLNYLNGSVCTAAAAALHVHAPPAAMLYCSRTSPSYFQRLTSWENHHEINISALAVFAFTLIVSEQSNRVSPQRGRHADKNNCKPLKEPFHFLDHVILIKRHIPSRARLLSCSCTHVLFLFSVQGSRVSPRKAKGNHPFSLCLPGWRAPLCYFLYSK